MILKLLLNTKIIYLVFIKILKNTIQTKQRKIFTVFDDMIVDMFTNQNLNPVITELFIRDRKLNISSVVVKESYFAVQKIIRLNYMDYFIMKIAIKA